MKFIFVIESLSLFLKLQLPSQYDSEKLLTTRLIYNIKKSNVKPRENHIS